MVSSRLIPHARAGVSTVLGYLPGDPHDPRQAVAEAEAAGGRAVAVACDVTDPASVDAFTDAAHDHFGRLDLVVANAGALDSAALADLSDDRWHRLLEVDLTGVLRTLRSAAAAMTGGGAMVAVIGPGWVLAVDAAASSIVSCPGKRSGHWAAAHAKMTATTVVAEAIRASPR